MVYSSRSPRKQSANEDAAALFEFDRRRGVLAVADGMGGLPKGQQASAVTLNEIQKNLRKQTALREGILNGIETANRRIINSKNGSGTTVALVELKGNLIRPYHVGDSEILLLGQRGRVKIQTVSHSPTGYAVHAGIIAHEEAMFHPQRHLIFNAVGFDDMRIEIGAVVEMAAKDTLLLATDGLLDNMFLDDICAIIRTGPLEEAAQLLVQQCQQNVVEPNPGQPSKPDDMTFILYRQTQR